MATLDEARTTADSAADHVADHNTLHALHNLLENGGSSSIAVVGTDTTTNTSSPTLTWPSVSSGDYAFVFVTTQNIVPTGPDAGSGWTELFLYDTSTNEYTGVWYKKCTGSESGTITFNGGATQSVALVVLSGIDGTNPFVSSMSFGDVQYQPLTVPVLEAEPDGYSLYWWLNCYNGSGTPAVTSSNPARSLTTHIALTNGNHHQILVAGRASGTFVSSPEVAENMGGGDTGYTSMGAINLRAA